MGVYAKKAIKIDVVAFLQTLPISINLTLFPLKKRGDFFTHTHIHMNGFPSLISSSAGSSFLPF